MSEFRREKTLKQPEYDFDVMSGQLLLGQVAIDAHIEIGGHPLDVHDIGMLLLDPNIKFTSVELARSKRKEFDRELALQEGRFIRRLIQASDPNAHLTTATINRARQVGLFSYAREKIIKSSDGFQTITNYFEAVGEKKPRRRARFDHMTIEDMIDHLKKVGKEEGQPPTIPILLRRMEEGKVEPSPALIKSIVKRQDASLGLLELYTLAGYPESVQLWSKDDYSNWARKVILANEGIEITEEIIEYFSSQKLGPSTHPISDYFGGVVKFRAEVKKQHAQTLAEGANDRNEKLAAIRGILDGSSKSKIPPEIFDGVTSEDELILRYAKYIVLDDLFPNNFRVTKISICTESTKVAAERGFVGAIRKEDETKLITAADIEVSASSLGVFDYIFPPDTSYMEILKLPEELLPTKNKITTMPARGRSSR